CLDRHLRARATELHLLSGNDAAGLAAASRLGAALDLCLRGNARRAVRANLPHRLFAQRHWPRPGLSGARRRRLLYRLPRRPPPRRALADGGIAPVNDIGRSAPLAARPRLGGIAGAVGADRDLRAALLERRSGARAV